MCSQERHLCRSFNSFCNYLEIQTLCHADDGSRDGRVIRIQHHILHEGTVYLQLTNRKLPQIAKAGVARAEVVDGQFQPHGAQFFKHREDNVHVGQQSAFGKLQFEVFRGKPGLGQYVLDDGKKVPLAKLNG